MSINDKIADIYQNWELEGIDIPEIEKTLHKVNIVLSIPMILLTTFVTMVGYNWIIPVITTLPKITFLQSMLLDFFISYFIIDTKISNEDFNNTNQLTFIARKMYFGIKTLLYLVIMFIIHIFI